MILIKLFLQNFRNFSNIKLDFIEGVNIITGMNAQGKTSILESIYYLLLTKSFKTSNDYSAINDASDFFNIRGKFRSLKGEDLNIRLYLSGNEGKHVFHNDKEISKFSDIIGKIPCVILTLDDIKLTFGGPSERRKYLNILLSQTSPVYLNDLKIYRNIVKQRNSLLLNSEVNNIKSQIEGWNKQLIDFGVRIIKKRQQFVDFLNSKIHEYYTYIANKEENISIYYKSTIATDLAIRNDDELKNIYEKKLHASFNYEYERKMTVIGPHRDDLIFRNGLKHFKEYCSQGENKTLIIVLKLLEWEYISKYTDMKPLLLLDDIFGELDKIRMKGLLKFINSVGQAFITTTLDDKFSFFNSVKRYRIENQKIYDA